MPHSGLPGPGDLVPLLPRLVLSVYSNHSGLLFCGCTRVLPALCLCTCHFAHLESFQLDSGMVTTFLSSKTQLTSKFLRWHRPDHPLESQSTHHAPFYFLDRMHASQDFSVFSCLSLIYNKLPPKECYSYDYHRILWDEVGAQQILVEYSKEWKSFLGLLRLPAILFIYPFLPEASRL